MLLVPAEPLSVSPTLVFPREKPHALWSQASVPTTKRETRRKTEGRQPVQQNPQPMRTRMAARNHPMQPLSPKHQPWFKTQAPDRNLTSLSKSNTESKSFGPSARNVEQELIVRARIEQRSSERQEKLHDAVSHDRLLRRRQRQRAAGHEGEIVKQELSKTNVQFER